MVKNEETGEWGIIWRLHAGQKRALLSSKRFILVLAGWQSGKALALDTPIPTPDGWKQMGDLQVGDKVFDEHRKPCRVTAVMTWKHREAYDVHFSDGSQVIADGEHEWPVVIGGSITTKQAWGVQEILAQKKERLQVALAHTDITIVGIYQARSLRNVKCIAVDSQSRLFLCGHSSIPTHNSEIGPAWLQREMVRKGPGDYLVASPTFMLMQKKVLPVFQRFFERQLRYGKFVGGKNIFTFSEYGCRELWGHVPDDPPRVLFGHAADPDSLESATIKACWCDEAGQTGFKLGSWEAILGRLSIHQGRVIITSRPYNLGWMKQKLYDPWEEASRNHPEIDIINFRSIDNPAFPADEYYAAQRRLPPNVFGMKYDGLFTRPLGLIYSSFDPKRMKIPRIEIPPEWPRHLGVDFGGVNTAATFWAEERIGSTPTGRLICYREYHAGERSAAGHIYEFLKGEPRIPNCYGGSKSEKQWRTEFQQGGTVIVNNRGELATDGVGKRVQVPGLPIKGPSQPEKEAIVETGIERCWEAFALGQLLICENCAELLDELGTYSREIDDAGNVTNKILNKEQFHLCDSMRYVLPPLNKPKATGFNGTVGHAGLKNL